MTSIELTQNELQTITETLKEYAATNQYRANENELRNLQELAYKLSTNIIGTNEHKIHQAQQTIKEIKQTLDQTESIEQQLAGVLQRLSALTNEVHKLRYQHRKQTNQ